MTPLEEALVKIVCAMDRQTDSKKLKRLNSLSKAHHYVVNKRWLHFLSCPLVDSDEARMDYIILMKDIISAVYTDQYLFIYCRNYTLYLLQLKTEALMVWLPDDDIQQEIAARKRRNNWLFIKSLIGL